MLGRRDLGDSGRLISSSRSPVAPPTDPLLQPKRPAALRGQRSSRSESFKALLLRKGSRSELSSRLSAVEQLRVVISSTTSADLRGVMSLPLPPPPPPPPKDSDVSSHTCGLNTHLTPDTSLYSQNFSVTFSWSQKQFLLNSSSSPFFLLSSFSSSIRPRSHTPPCTSSRRSSARCRLYTAPMTAIFEEEREEEEEEEVFMEQSRRTVEM